MRIFVSATTTDLGSYRDAVARQLRRLGVETEVQSDFGVDYRELTVLLKEKLRWCDAIICLVGHLYGSAPARQNTDKPRSYSQIEYDLAQALNKPTFTFFPSSKCRLDGRVMETDEKRALQQEYWKSLREGGRKWEEFNDSEHACLLTAEAVEKTRNSVAQTKLARLVLDRFPTPLALLFNDCFTREQERSLRRLAAESLRFIALLAVHDSLVHGSFELEHTQTSPEVRSLALEMEPHDWFALLRLACIDESFPPSRLVAEFAGWERRHANALTKLLSAEARFKKEVIPDHEIYEAMREIRESISAVYSDLEFLGRYVLLGITDIGSSETGTCKAQVLRGLHPRAIELNVAPGSSVMPQKDELYLLCLDRRQALCLSPAFWYFGKIDQYDTYGLLRLHSNSALGLELRSFHGGRVRIVPDPQDPIGTIDLTRLLGQWLGTTLCEQAFGLQVQTGEPQLEANLFTNESWELLRRTVLPAGEEEVIVGGRFRLPTSPIHRGLHADVFEVILDSSVMQPHGGADAAMVVGPRHPIVHLLRREGIDDVQVRAWFEQRFKCWRQIVHPHVLTLYEEGNPVIEKVRPFLLTDRVSGENLDHLLQAGEPLSDSFTLETLALAADVCRIAHKQGIYLMTFPARHFLIDQDGGLHLTGFEAAVPANECARDPGERSSYFKRFSKDWRMLAPEALHSRALLAPTVDIFAIGCLLARLRDLPAIPMDALPLGAWTDAWRCLAFHCLAADPHMRFQTADQFLMFLKDWIESSRLPQTVSIPAGMVRHNLKGQEHAAKVPTFAISRFPVTNREYLQFCRTTKYPLPQHLRSQTGDSSSFHRLNGPWLPVTYVNLLDAQAYCLWLSTHTGMKWRLPYEREWIRAAEYGLPKLTTGDTKQAARTYPWGISQAMPRLANYGHWYRGPTVVGAFGEGRSAAGCFDMGGNVWEWCLDYISGEPLRVLKGGSFYFPAEAMTPAHQRGVLLTYRSEQVGFRMICEKKL